MTQADQSPTETYRNKTWLRTEYAHKERTQEDVASELTISSSTVRRWLERRNIPKRNNSSILSDGRTNKLQNKHWLSDQYVTQQKSTCEISSELGVASTTVSHWLAEHDIETRGNDPLKYIRKLNQNE